MEHRPVRNAPFTASVVGLGCNNLGRVGVASETAQGVADVVHAAIDAGVTFFDTADRYGAEWGLSETLLGLAIAHRRDEVVVATKFGHLDFPTPLDPLGAKGSRAYIRASVDASLTRLGIDTIDLYQQHMPDSTTPIEDTLSALAELVEEGKIRAYGHTQFSADDIRASEAAAVTLGVAPFVSSQDELSLIARDVESNGRLDAAAAVGLGFLPFFPLANGLSTGKFTRTSRPAGTRIAEQRPQIAEHADWDAMEAFEVFAADRGITMLEATFGWFLARPVVSSVIAGATRPEQVRQNAESSSWRPTPDELAFIDGLFPPKAAG